MGMDVTGQNAIDGGTAGIRLRPPLLFLGALVLGFGLEHLLPLPFPIGRTGLGHWLGAYIAGGLILLGIAVFAAGIRSFSNAGTPVQRTKPARALVTTGIHGWSRNPIYLGMLFALVGIGLVTRNPWILILVLPFAVTIRYGVVAREEAYLERRFGNAYRAYKARVRRWL